MTNTGRVFPVKYSIEAIIRKDRNQPNIEIIPDGKLFDLTPLHNRLTETKH
jgi:hypothetical protein